MEQNNKTQIRDRHNGVSKLPATVNMRAAVHPHLIPTAAANEHVINYCHLFPLSQMTPFLVCESVFSV